jgi:hypothetical protein
MIEFSATSSRPIVLGWVACCIVSLTGVAAGSAPTNVTFSAGPGDVECYDFVEVSLEVSEPNAVNPFTDVQVKGQFAKQGDKPVHVVGFCDSANGGLFRIRFMPTQPGAYDYSVTYKQGGYQATHRGRFTARDAHRRGLVRVDPDYPWHFLWRGTGEHYFWNGTTTYWLLGWDDQTIRSNIDRLASLKVNRLRVAINGRVKFARVWFENVFPTDTFSFLLNPWVARRPESVAYPDFDVTRFNVAYWRKIESMLRYAREKDVVISIIFYVDGRRPGVDPFSKQPGSEDEQRYYRYAVARLAAFSNVMWDVTNEYHLFRDEAWANRMGALLKQCDPYDHLASVHGNERFAFRTSLWADFAMYQSWDEAGGYRFMLDNRRQQTQTGRIVPQVNEEYGYEDHYPTGWGGNRQPPARSADSRRRLAWGMYMAGGYQTTGERADTGTGWGPDTGGGWVNGRGDDSMVMLKGYGHIVDFFTAIPWWRLNPDNDFFEAPQETAAKPELSHVAYTRDSRGRAVLYVNGKAAATDKTDGGFANWDQSFRLALGNELTGDRPWLGEVHRVALYARALDEADVAGDFKGRLQSQSPDPLVLYDFQQATGDTIQDISGIGEPLNLKIENVSAVQWLDGGGLRIASPVLIASPGSATKLADAVRRSNALTVEVWITPANATQAGPARIVTLSRDAANRDFTLGQKGGAYEVRLRTTTTSFNGEPAISYPTDEGIPPVVGLRSREDHIAVLYFAAGGQADVKADVLAGNPDAQWFNPRTGEWSPARAGREGLFVAPDNLDWSLRLAGKATQAPR